MTHSAPKSELTHFNKDITHLSKCMQTRASTRERVMLVHTRVDFGFWIALDRRMNSNYARKSWLSCLKKSQNGLISTHSWICWDESDTSMKSHGSIEMNHEKDMNVLKWIMTWLISMKSHECVEMSWMCWDESVLTFLRWVSHDLRASFEFIRLSIYGVSAIPNRRKSTRWCTKITLSRICRHIYEAPCMFQFTYMNVCFTYMKHTSLIRGSIWNTHLIRTQ